MNADPVPGNLSPLRPLVYLGVAVAAWYGWRHADPSGLEPLSISLPIAATAPMPSDHGATLVDSSAASDPTLLQPAVVAPPAEVSIGQMVGQQFMISFFGATLPDDVRTMIRKHQVGGIVLFASNENVQDPAQVAALVADAQAEAMRVPGGLPLFVAIDEEGGRVSRLGAGFVSMPSQLAIGAVDSPDLAAAAAKATATQLLAIGVNMNLAPVLDTLTNSDNEVIGNRSFGFSAARVAELGSVMARAYKESGILAVVKHFPGHGDTDLDSHVDLPTVRHGLDRLSAFELVPFQRAIDDGVDAIMTAHLLVPAIDPELPVSLSPHAIDGLLRGDMGFDGLVVSDSLGMGAIRKSHSLSEAVQLAVRAGTNIVAIGADEGVTVADQRTAYEDMVAAAGADEALRAQVADSYRRIEAAKAAYRLTAKSEQGTGVIPQVALEDARAVASKLSSDSVTLVRDGNGVVGDLSASRSSVSLTVVLPSGLAHLATPIGSTFPGVTVVGGDVNANQGGSANLNRAESGADPTVVFTRNVRHNPADVALVNAWSGPGQIVVSLGDPFALGSFPDVQAFVVTYDGTDAAALAALASITGRSTSPPGCLPVQVPGLVTHGTGFGDACREPNAHSTK